MVQKLNDVPLLQLVFLGLAFLGVACGDSPTEPEPFDVNDVQFAEELDVTVADLEERESGLFVYDVVVGEGAAVDPEGTVEVHLTLWLADGTLVGDSRQDESTVTLDLQGDLIPGFEEGILGMNEGGIRILVLPPELGYGQEGAPPNIPGNTGLVFRIEVVSVSSSSSTT